jgi:hypothetical protein
MNRVDPDQHAIKRGKLRAYRVEYIIFVDNWYCIDADSIERRKDGLKAVVLGYNAAPRRFVSSP